MQTAEVHTFLRQEIHSAQPDYRDMMFSAEASRKAFPQSCSDRSREKDAQGFKQVAGVIVLMRWQTGGEQCGVACTISSQVDMCYRLCGVEQNLRLRTSQQTPVHPGLCVINQWHRKLVIAMHGVLFRATQQQASIKGEVPDVTAHDRECRRSIVRQSI